jgi:ABC-type multidrug transport system fused ATPase/permease subunit
MFEMEEACNVLLEFIYEDDKVAEVVSDDSAKSGHLLGVVTENISMTEAPKPVYASRHSACHLTFRNVALICDDLTVFSRLSFDLKPGQRAFILCATSQQKVSVLDTLSFLAPHSTGTVLIDDNVVSIDSDGHNIRREVALCIPQNFTISGMSVEKNILQFSASPPSLKELCSRAGIDSDLGDLSMFGDSLMPDGIPPCMSLIAQLLRLFVNPSRMVVVDAAVLSRSNSYHRAVSSSSQFFAPASHCLPQIPKIISSLSEGKTSIVVADMLLPVSSAFYQSFESIHVLDATGACVEFGTHDELLRLTHFRARLQEISDWRDDMNGLFTASAQRK